MFGKRNNQNVGAGMYTRQNVGNHEATVVPGMNDKNAPDVNPPSKNNAPDAPVVGFLYSISRYGIGEYWPIHIGRNTIGRSEDCDICLKELTISDHHAALNVKRLVQQDKVIASIQDIGSKTGLFINDQELGYEQQPCEHMDVFTIGRNYKLLFILIDANKMGLSVSEDFQAVEENLTSQVPPHMNFGDNTNSMYDSSNRAQNGTVTDGMAGPTDPTNFATIH